MISEIVALVAFLIENCTGVVLIEKCGTTSMQSTESEALLNAEERNLLEDDFDPKDTIFQEFDSPEHLEADPKAWKINLPTFRNSFWECLKSVLFIQTLAGALVGVVGVALIFFDYVTDSYCYYEVWNKLPKMIKNIRITGACIEGLVVQMWDFCLLWTVFPFSFLNKLNLLAVSMLAAFMDITYKLFLHMFTNTDHAWMNVPINAFFCLVVLVNHYQISRHFYPRSCKERMNLFFIITSQFFLGLPLCFYMVYKVIPFYVQQEQNIKLVVATAAPLLLAIPKVICRLGAQRLKRIVHPGFAHIFITPLYGASAIVFRVLQAELTSLGLFIALGIAHAITDLLERITITMRDHIWEYLYRLVRRQGSRQPKYRSPRCRRFIADVSIQIMMQESTALITALGFIAVYHFIYIQPELSNNRFSFFISFFICRVFIGLSIDLVFNTISLLIQTRVMNLAVNRVWKKKWCHHLAINTLVVVVSVFYFSDNLITIVGEKTESFNHLTKNRTNCSLPSFL